MHQQICGGSAHIDSTSSVSDAYEEPRILKNRQSSTNSASMPARIAFDEDEEALDVFSFLPWLASHAGTPQGTLREVDRNDSRVKADQPGMRG